MQEEVRVEGGGFLRKRTKREAFSGASPFPVVDVTMINACFFMALPSEGDGLTTHDSISFFRLNIFNSITSAVRNAEGGVILDSLMFFARSLAMCSALPVAEP